MNQDWKTLNIWDFRKELAIGKRTDFPANLCLVRKVYSENIYASYLPDLEEDPRIRKKYESGIKKKRRPITKSTGEPLKSTMFFAFTSLGECKSIGDTCSEPLFSGSVELREVLRLG